MGMLKEKQSVMMQREREIRSECVMMASLNAVFFFFLIKSLNAVTHVDVDAKIKYDQDMTHQFNQMTIFNREVNHQISPLGGLNNFSLFFIPGLTRRTHRLFVPFEGLIKRKGIHFIRNKIIIYLKTEQLCLLYTSYELI